jgi:hypothetical protein
MPGFVKAFSDVRGHPVTAPSRDPADSLYETRHVFPQRSQLPAYFLDIGCRGGFPFGLVIS